ncbi:hypothetical protein [Pseudomonas shirazensis]|uniref:hypothetical protein n=1 Tax=Pseudomonas shirazensis TaxID=2745494 RepID=UPI003D2E03B5
MSSAPSFLDLLVRVDQEYPSEFTPGAHLSDDQSQQLERISTAASQSVITLTSGIAAIGEMLAWVGTSEEVSGDALASLGWLLNHLGETSCRLHDEARNAEYKLRVLPRYAPQKPAAAKRGAGGAV